MPRRVGAISGPTIPSSVTEPVLLRRLSNGSTAGLPIRDGRDLPAGGDEPSRSRLPSPIRRRRGGRVAGFRSTRARSSWPTRRCRTGEEPRRRSTRRSGGGPAGRKLQHHAVQKWNGAAAARQDPSWPGRTTTATSRTLAGQASRGYRRIIRSMALQPGIGAATSRRRARRGAVISQSRAGHWTADTRAHDLRSAPA